MKLEHLIRFDTAEDKIFLQEYLNDIDLIVFNANILCHQSTNKADTLYSSFPNKKFFIDPRLYSFQLNLSNIKNKAGKIKSSYMKLAIEYGLDYVIDSDTSLTIEQVLKHGLNKLSEDILDFQNNFINENLDSEMKEMISFSKQFRTPEILIAPAFCILDEKDLKWLDINKKLLDISLKVKDKYNKPLYANLIISKEILSNKKAITQILDIYCKADGMVFWIDDFNEVSINENIIENLISLLIYYKQKNQTKKIYSLYGGYLHQILFNFGLNGVCHSVAYGESKKINHGGGIPLSKFYLPMLYKRMQPESMIRLIRDIPIKTKKEFYEYICNCPICKKIINNDNIKLTFFSYLDDLEATDTIRRNAKYNCRSHYLEVKKKEFTLINTRTFEDLVKILEDTYKNISINHYMVKPEYIHLDRWIKVLKSYI